jgi:Ni/Co efflux regulator RcnB
MEVKVSKGFLVFAQNTETVNYLKQAYALALSIKATQAEVTNISVVTDAVVPDEYRKAFDQVIEIPWGDLAKNPLWKIENRWKLYHASPYEETIVLDTDMLMLHDISDWWDYCSASDLKFCSKVRNYKGEVVEKDMIQRRTFVENNLSNPYVALHYFKKSQLAYEFYRTLEFVVKNWEECYKLYCPKLSQKWLSIDLATAIAISIMGIEDVVIDNASPLEFVHMKTAIQGIKPVPSTWQGFVQHRLTTDGEMFVGNIRQRFLFHYVEKDFLNDSLISQLEQRLEK